MTYLEKIKYCNDYLLELMPEVKKQASQFPDDEQGQRRLMRSLMNICPPADLGSNYYIVQDEVLSLEKVKKGIVNIDDMTEREKGIYLWQGDITRIAAGAIVNAANSKILGCFVPLHGCIDNAIHSAAGLQLRSECFDIMQAQGHDEPTGKAKLTESYNLPCEKIIHTVGPIVSGGLNKRHSELLKSCYRECFLLAAGEGLKSIAFCCISTGEFMFPNRQAARIAVETVRELKEKNDLNVVFNVFKDEDRVIYDELLG